MASDVVKVPILLITHHDYDHDSPCGWDLKRFNTTEMKNKETGQEGDEVEKSDESKK